MNKQFMEDIEEFVIYASVCAKILKENGYEGKAEALEERYIKLQTMAKIAQQTRLKDILEQKAKS